MRRDVDIKRKELESKEEDIWKVRTSINERVVMLGPLTSVEFQKYAKDKACVALEKYFNL